MEVFPIFVKRMKYAPCVCIVEFFITAKDHDAEILHIIAVAVTSSVLMVKR